MKFASSLLLSTLFLSAPFLHGEESLAAQLEEAASNSPLPPEIKEQMARHRDEVEATGIYDQAKKKGDTAPDFSLEDYRGEDVDLAGLLNEGPVVLMWYRGGW